jgi:hypothetical protein
MMKKMTSVTGVIAGHAMGKGRSIARDWFVTQVDFSQTPESILLISI